MTSLSVRYKQDFQIEAGVDEAGRGCLWGPLYAAAVIWPPEEDWLDEHREVAPQIQDSKKLTPKKRATLANAIQAFAIDVGIGVVTPQEIDSFGMTIANKMAFERALDALSVPPDRILLDGILALDQGQLTERSIEEQCTIIEGDAKYLPIAAASIIAKEAHDAYVQDAVLKDPTLETKYNLNSCKGYGTEKHRKGILAEGKDKDHRNLFLRKLLGQETETETETECLITDT